MNGGAVYAEGWGQGRKGFYYFSVIEGNSGEWGTSPLLTYMTSLYVPKLLRESA